MILHITNDYSGSTVYKSLIRALDSLGLSQIVYNPVKEESRIGKNKIELETAGSKIMYSLILNKTTDRIFYRTKIRKIVKDIESKIDFSTVRMIHAHTWYSDGGVAYLIAKKYHIPFIVTIRNSDLNFFHKYLLHERSFGRNILDRAKNVVLISASYRNRVLGLPSLSSIKSELLPKLKIIPNGVDEYWIQNAVLKNAKITNRICNLLYIGKFARGKNVLQVQRAVNKINSSEKKVHLHLIGGGGKAEKKVLEEVQLNPTNMTYHGKLFELSKLKEYYQQADIFVMPSSYETFGLVYVEAMLQGLPILYTVNEGIDGFYDENIGEKVTSNSVSEIGDSILKLIDTYNCYILPTEKLISNHDWKDIAMTYQSLYNHE